MLSSVTIKDPVFVEKENYSLLNRFFLRFIKDKRDLPFIHLSLQITFFVIPAALYLFIAPHFSWILASIYLLVNLTVFLGPCVLMLHNTSHRKLFKKEYDFMNNYIPWIIGPFYGETPETYYHHHVTMHHPENNQEGDLSSTMHFQRDSFIDFGKYFLRFIVLGIFELAIYFKRKNQISFLKKIILGELSFTLLCVGLAMINFKATLVVFIIPLAFVRFAMMSGNWAQHAFIDAAEPHNRYKNSITCINSLYNRRCFNDGYHIGHHLRPAMHWTDMPKEFEKEREKYIYQKAIVFEGLDYFQIWFLLMIKNYSFLAKKVVVFDTNLTGADIIGLLRERTKRIV